MHISQWISNFWNGEFSHGRLKRFFCQANGTQLIRRPYHPQIHYLEVAHFVS